MKSDNLRACNTIISEKLSLKNFLHDAMDFQAIRQLMVKSRHKILMPTLVLALTKTKLKNSGSEYKTSFARNIHERTDWPVFTIDDAVAQLIMVDDSRSQVEKAMDDFFLSHLPEDVME
jgi:RNase H-fold protein (predicted Holliday junction resolvase)